MRRFQNPVLMFYFFLLATPLFAAPAAGNEVGRDESLLLGRENLTRLQMIVDNVLEDRYFPGETPNYKRRGQQPVIKKLEFKDTFGINPDGIRRGARYKVRVLAIHVPGERSSTHLKPQSILLQESLTARAKKGSKIHDERLIIKIFLGPDFQVRRFVYFKQRNGQLQKTVLTAKKLASLPVNRYWVSGVLNTLARRLERIKPLCLSHF